MAASHISQIVCEDLPVDEDDEFYTPTERLLYKIIKTSPLVEDKFKQNPATASIYFTHVLSDLNSESQIISSDKYARRFKHQSLDKNYEITIQRAPKSSLRLYIEGLYYKYVDSHKDEFSSTDTAKLTSLTYFNLADFADSNDLVKNLWDYMFQNSIVEYALYDDDWSNPEEYFEGLDYMLDDDFDDFLENYEYNEHQIMELNLIYSGDQLCIK